MLSPALLLLCSIGFGNPEPQYRADPFGDQQLTVQEDILHLLHPLDRRLELGVSFFTSMRDKYSAHLGFAADASYFVTDELGFNMWFGAAHGVLSDFVTGSAGLVANNVFDCLVNNSGCEDITPRVPHFFQLRGVATLAAVWAPAYGKIGLFGAADMHLRFYALLGGGIAGIRRPQAQLAAGAAERTDFVLIQTGLSDGGLFDDVKPHGAMGVGVRAHLTQRLSLRFESRLLVMRDRFAFDGGLPESYLATFWLNQFGAVVQLGTL